MYKRIKALASFIVVAAMAACAAAPAYAEPSCDEQGKYLTDLLDPGVTVAEMRRRYSPKDAETLEVYETLDQFALLAAINGVPIEVMRVQGVAAVLELCYKENGV